MKPRAPAPNATKVDLPSREKCLARYFAVTRLAVDSTLAMSSVDSDIRDFLAAKTDGEALWHALYDHVLDEPVPRRLRALLEN